MLSLTRYDMPETPPLAEQCAARDLPVSAVVGRRALYLRENGYVVDARVHDLCFVVDDPASPTGLRWGLEPQMFLECVARLPPSGRTVDVVRAMFPTLVTAAVPSGYVLAGVFAERLEGLPGLLFVQDLSPAHRAAYVNHTVGTRAVWLAPALRSMEAP